MTLTDRELDDVLRALAEDDTVDDGSVVALRARVLEAVEHEAVALVSLDGVEVLSLHARSPRRRRWLPSLVAVAALVLVAIVTTTLVVAHRATDPGPAAAAPDVTCSVDPQAPSADADRRATRLVRARLLGTDGTVTTSPGHVAVRVSGLADRALTDLCSAPRASLRPLVTAPIPYGPATTSPERLGILPSTSAGYDALTDAGRFAVRREMQEIGCGGDASTDRPVVVCDSASDPTELYLLGPAVVTADDLGDAYAQQSPAGDGTWLVQVGFTPAGSAGLDAYTRAHNLGGTEGSTAPCGPTTTSCADYLGVVVDGTVVAASTIQSEITGSLQLQSGYDEPTATVLAAAFAAGDLMMSVA